MQPPRGVADREGVDMSERTCLICGGDPGDPRAKTCRGVCRRAHRAALKRAREADSREPHPGCSVCGVTLTDVRAKTCRGTCRTKRLRDLERLRRGVAVPEIGTRRCEICTGLIPESRTLQAKYCGRSCQQKAYYRNNREKRQANVRRWVTANRGYYEQWHAEYRAKNRDKIVRGHRERYAKNPEPYKAARDLRRAQQRSTPGPHRFTEQDWRDVLRHYSGCCAYCGSAARLEKEHVIPLSRGGRDTVGNVVPACHPCNRAKAAKTITEWRAQQRRRSSLAVEAGASRGATDTRLVRAGLDH